MPHFYFELLAQILLLSIRSFNKSGAISILSLFSKIFSFIDIILFGINFDISFRNFSKIIGFLLEIRECLGDVRNWVNLIHP